VADAKKRLYRFLVKMGRITEAEYETAVGEPYEL